MTNTSGGRVLEENFYTDDSQASTKHPLGRITETMNLVLVKRPSHKIVPRSRENSGLIGYIGYSGHEPPKHDRVYINAIIYVPLSSPSEFAMNSSRGWCEFRYPGLRN